MSDIAIWGVGLYLLGFGLFTQSVIRSRLVRDITKDDEVPIEAAILIVVLFAVFWFVVVPVTLILGKRAEKRQ